MSERSPSPAHPGEIITVRPERELFSRQQLPYFAGISGESAGATGISMNLTVIQPARAIVARNDCNEQESVAPYNPSSEGQEEA